MTTTSLLVGFAVLVPLLALFAAILRHIAAAGASTPVTPEWIGGFSTARYRPMERLLDEADHRFLAAHGELGRQLSRRLRSQRRRLFRAYLRCMERDFSRTSAILKRVALNATQDRPELVSALFKQRVLFAVGMVGVEIRLTLHGLGLASVDARRLVQAIESMRDQATMLIAAPSPSAA